MEFKEYKYKRGKDRCRIKFVKNEFNQWEVAEKVYWRNGWERMYFESFPSEEHIDLNFVNDIEIQVLKLKEQLNATS